MKRTKFRKHHTILSLLLLIAVTAVLAVVTGTLASFRDHGIAQNYLYSKPFKVDLVDDFVSGLIVNPGDTLNKDVYMTNNGELDAVIRLKLSPSWEPVADGSGKPLDPLAVSVAYGPTFVEDWTYSNGWYYYNWILEPGESSNYLVDSIKLADVANDHHAANYSGAVYTLNVSSDSLQSYPEATLESWGMTFQENESGKLTWSGGGV